MGVVVTACADQAKQKATDTLTIKTATATHTFKIEVAVTDAQKARGLMFRNKLPAGTGMLFPYAKAQEISMWMKNTYISLDMIFIRADGTIHRVAAETEPLSETIVASHGPVIAVLEIAGGEAKRLGLGPGDRVIHPSLKPAK